MWAYRALEICRTLAVLFAALTAAASSMAEIIRVPLDAPTIDAAMHRASSGDLIRVAPGTYRESIRFKGGVELAGEERNEVVVIAPANDGPVLSVTDCPEGLVRSMTFRHDEGNPIEDDAPPPVVDIVRSSITLEWCNVEEGAGAGISISESGTPTLLNCRIARNRGNGVTVRGVTTNLTVVDSIVTQNNVNGLVFDKETVKGLVEASRFTENGDTGLAVFEKGAAITTRNNLMRDNGRYGIWVVVGSRLDSTNDDFIHNAFFNKREIQLLLTTPQFDRLEDLAERLRLERPRFTSGYWQLPSLYDYTTDLALANERSRRHWLVYLNRWRNQYPDSVTPRVALADLYNGAGWKARGDAYAHEVTEEGWRGLRENCAIAWQIVTQARRQGLVDPELYRQALQAVMGLGGEVDASLWDDAYGSRPRTEAEFRGLQQAIYEEAVQLDPYYTNMYSRRVSSLLPRWGGVPAEIVALAEDAVRRTKEVDGESYYALIAERAFYHEKIEVYAGAYTFSWPRIRAGIDDFVERYPRSFTLQSRFALMAAIHQDQNTTARLIDELGGDWDRSVFGSAHRKDQVHHWATNGGWFPIDPEYTAAIEAGNLSIVTRKIESGASVDATFPSGATVLYLAVEHDYYDIAKTLLEAGADPNVAWGEGWTPLIMAAYNNRLRQAKLLIDYGVELDAQHSDGFTALNTAANRGYAEIVEALLAAGADPTIPSNGGETPLDRARRNNHAEVIKALDAHLSTRE